jgi:transportin-1
VLPHLLPLIEQNLKSADWEVQESGVLAVGAIAHGCMYDLAPHLPQVMGLLLQICSAQKPLLRSISCWCVSRYASWIVHDENAGKFLAPALGQLLTHVLDRNKRVQEAACSAFATLEEEARHKLLPYLGEIVGKIVEAYKFYQAKNLLILYDATGTLAESVGEALDTPQYSQQLLPLIFARLQAATDQDRSLVALFECLTQLAHHMPKSFQPHCAATLARCVRIIKNSLDQYQQWKQVGEMIDPPDREILASAIDAVAGMVAGMGETVLQCVQQNEAQCGFVQLLPMTCAVDMLQVKQASFALLGDLAKSLPQGLPAALLGQLITACGDHLQHLAPAVANNASWAIGEICIKAGPQAMSPYVDHIAEALIQTLTNSQGTRAHVLIQNTCITLGRLALVCAPQLGAKFPAFARQWCVVMMGARNDAEKANAYQGLCLLIQANSQVMMDGANFFWLLKSVAAFHQDSPYAQPPPPQLAEMIKQVLHGYKGSHGASWSQIWEQLTVEEKQRLSQMYGLQ